MFVLNQQTNSIYKHLVTGLCYCYDETSTLIQLFRTIKVHVTVDFAYQK